MGINEAPDIARNIDKSQLNLDCRVLDHLQSAESAHLDCRFPSVGLGYQQRIQTAWTL